MMTVRVDTPSLIGNNDTTTMAIPSAQASPGPAGRTSRRARAVQRLTVTFFFTLTALRYFEPA